ncbi:hypothetical protein ABZW44_48025 [Streptomyces mirabilis]|uniref:hypothetical protein n=1 Tax=Streptomyces mirabilis TaxID=68239 RepID=UPI0033B88D5B
MTWDSPRPRSYVATRIRDGVLGAVADRAEPGEADRLPPSPVRMIRWEAPLVAPAGMVLGTAIALATLVPMMKGPTGQGPYIPPLLYGPSPGRLSCSV